MQDGGHITTTPTRPDAGVNARGRPGRRCGPPRESQPRIHRPDSVPRTKKRKRAAAQTGEAEEGDCPVRQNNMPPAIGARFMIFRQLQKAAAPGSGADGPVKDQWLRCSCTTPSKQPDSRVHRYARKIGFRRPDADQMREETDARVAATLRRLRRSGKGDCKSHSQRIKRWSLFERYCLERHEQDPWCQWLLQLNSLGDEQPSDEVLDSHIESRQVFVAPPVPLLLTYIETLRQDGEDESGRFGGEEAHHSGGTIRVYVGAIGVNCLHFCH